MNEMLSPLNDTQNLQKSIQQCHYDKRLLFVIDLIIKRHYEYNIVLPTPLTFENAAS